MLIELTQDELETAYSALEAWDHMLDAEIKTADLGSVQGIAKQKARNRALASKFFEVME